MQQFPSSDSLGALISICPSKEDELQAMLDVGLEKKRRLSSSQVRALEKCFAAEKKVEPERKVRLAAELGLQPRQVAVWFQNRRARWKNNQLHRDFAALRADYDLLKRDFKALQQEKEALSTKVRELKEKLNLSDSHSPEINKEPQSSPMMTFENMGGSSSSSVMNWFQMPDLRMIPMEEQSLLRSEESCNINIYSVDQPPTLHCLLLRPLQETSKQ